jgi:hypothetical protein
MAKTGDANEFDPHALAAWVKKVAQLRRENAVAGQPHSPSSKAGWGLVLVAVVASYLTFFTIRARRMGSLPDLCVTTRAVAPGY